MDHLYFYDEGQVKITAASVGISRARWIAINETDIDSGKHIDLMKSNRFDHLPIIGTNGTITEFFKTDEPNNFNNISKHVINYNDVISLDANIKDVIEKFANEKRTFFFLSFHRNISGLITIGNLNCKQVQIYVFSLVCDLERNLADFLNGCKKNIEIEEWVTGKANIEDPADKYFQILKKFKDLTEQDLENQLTEHFFLVDFFTIISDMDLFEKLSYTKKEWKELSSINEIRKRIAHPTRCLLDKENDIFKLYSRLNKIEDLNFRLKSFEKFNSRKNHI
ncbi:MAG: hypothetical protein WAT79_04380 [Saprospiraceae bacterium]